MKKILTGLLALVLIFTMVACSNGTTNDGETNGETSGANSGPIHVISREDGSGTRSAFVEIVGIIDYNKNDMTTQTATIQDGTGKVIETVVSDKTAIGYISLGSVDGSQLKTLAVDGVEATSENVLSGDYAIQRPLNIAYKPGSLSETAQNFVDFIMSKQGQAIAVQEGFVEAAPDAAEYTGSGVTGEINISGSTSVEPLVQAAAEAYQKINPDVKIVINATGSSAGVKDATDGVVDFGMASRELSEDELANLEAKVLAKDGIAVVVAQDNPTTTISLDSIKGIYLGEITDWGQVK